MTTVLLAVVILLLVEGLFAFIMSFFRTRGLVITRQRAEELTKRIEYLKKLERDYLIRCEYMEIDARALQIACMDMTTLDDEDGKAYYGTRNWRTIRESMRREAAQASGARVPQKIKIECEGLADGEASA